MKETWMDIKKSIVETLALFGLLTLFSTVVFSAASETGSTADARQTVTLLAPRLIAQAPVIDGVLDDLIWQEPATVDDVFITYNPIDGQVLPQKTRVWLAYDEDNLYFAFYCHDDQPDKIKTSVAKRDTMFNDDWIGVALDPLGNRQCLYELFINPSGMQGDLYSTPGTGENGAPDWVWYSGGKIVEDGYTVEVKLPLKSIRFKHGDRVKMHMLFWRRVSRLGVSGAWPMIDPGKGAHNSTAEVVYDSLEKQLLLEFIPSVTYGSLWDRSTPVDWLHASGNGDVGISAKYGITSNTVAELSVNPDFSQVESDAFQILQNQRYPIFYSEKRPFFMEAGDLFSLAGSSENMATAVHTRRIVDPLFGARLTGDMGKLTYGLLGALDEWPGRETDGEDNFYLGKKALYTIGRAKYGLGGDNHLGLLYSGKELGDYANRAVAIDGNLRFANYHTLRANFIGTYTRDPEAGENYGGSAYSAYYLYSTKSFVSTLDLEHYDADFRMDTAFYRRTGISRAQLFLIPLIAIESKTFDWVKSVKPVFATSYLYDHTTDMWDRYLNVGVIWNFIRQGNLTLAWDIADNESWQGTYFKKSAVWGNGGVQLFKWLRLGAFFHRGGHIYYDSEDPFLGDRLMLSFGLNLQPLATLALTLSYDYTDFNRRSDGADIYDYHILYTRATYQPNKHLFFRALVQYDSYLDEVMSDILASYEFVPGTVFHVGYGSLHQQLFWDTADKRWRSGTVDDRLYQTSQSFFVKISYRLQF